MNKNCHRSKLIITLAILIFIISQAIIIVYILSPYQNSSHSIELGTEVKTITRLEDNDDDSEDNSIAVLSSSHDITSSRITNDISMNLPNHTFINTATVYNNNTVKNDRRQSASSSYFTILEEDADRTTYNQSTCVWVHFDKRDNGSYDITGWDRRVNHHHQPHYNTAAALYRRLASLEATNSSSSDRIFKKHSRTNQTNNIPNKRNGNNASTIINKNNNLSKRPTKQNQNTHRQPQQQTREKKQNAANKHTKQNHNNKKHKQTQQREKKQNTSNKRKQMEDIIQGLGKTKFKKTKQPNGNQTQTQQPPQKEEIYFIHIGKAGGTSIACNIRVARKRMSKECSPYPLLTESAISQKVTQRFHIRHPQTEAYQYILTVRNPVDRIKSWFIYEHSKNFGVSSAIPLTIGMHRPCGQIMFYMCWDSLDDFASVGLAGSRPFSDPTETPLHLPNVSVALNEHDCHIYAWAAVQGYVASSFHNFWNYHKYTKDILTKHTQEGNLTFWILRNEHLWSDWNTIDKMLGATNVVTPVTGPNTILNNVSGNSTLAKILPITNYTVGINGIKNLCKALCDEIQIYKQLLRLGRNLSPEEKLRSLEELRDTCPDEISLEVRNCTYL